MGEEDLLSNKISVMQSSAGATKICFLVDVRILHVDLENNRLKVLINLGCLKELDGLLFVLDANFTVYYKEHKLSLGSVKIIEKI